ncbi:MAG: beta-galactosidase trimerization domain-containing protein [Candidatus Bathyarchaeia archaeon]
MASSPCWPDGVFIRCLPHLFRGVDAPLPLKEAIKRIVDMHANSVWTDYERRHISATDEEVIMLLNLAQENGLKTFLLNVPFDTGDEETSRKFFEETSDAQAENEWIQVYKPGLCLNNSKLLEHLSKVMEGTIKKFKSNPAFFGISLDEPNYRGCYCKRCGELFRKYLSEKYSPKELEDLGLEIEKVEPPTPKERWDERVLWSEWTDFTRDTLTYALRTIVNAGKSISPETYIAIVMMPGWFAAEPSSNPFVSVAAICDTLHPDPYAQADPVEGLFYELSRNASPYKRVWSWVDTRFSKPTTLKRDVFLSALHTDGVFVGYWSSGMYGFTSERQEAVGEAFQILEKVEKYLVKTESIAKIALLYSEKTAAMNYFGAVMKAGSPYFNNVAGMYTICNQSHIPIDPIFVETLTPKMLTKYNVLIAVDTECLSDQTAELIRDWVRNGGVLLATTRTSIQDEYGRRRRDFALEDVFQASFGDEVGGNDRAYFEIVENHPAIKSLKKGERIDYMGSMYPGVSLKPERKDSILATWNDGSPAMILSDYGKGKSLLLGTTHLTQHYLLSREKDEKARALFRDVIEWGLKLAGEKLPIVIEGTTQDVNKLGWYVESSLRMQSLEDGSRMILQILGQGSLQQSVFAKIAIPKDNFIIKVLDPITDSSLEYTVTDDGYVRFKVPNFELYQMIVAIFRTSNHCS